MGTIAEEISALQGRISAAYNALALMGGGQPAKEDTWHLVEAIESLPTSKYGVPLGGVLGDVDYMGYGILQQPTEEYALSTDQLFGIGENALRNKFFDEPTLTAVSLPNMRTVESYGMYQAFAQCSSLVRVELPALTGVGTYGMYNCCYGCSSLSGVDFGNVESVDTYGMYQAFTNTGLTGVDLPKLSALGTYGLTRAFYGCSALEVVNLSSLKKFTTQGLNAAFQNCGNLREVYLTNLSSAGTALQNGMTNTFNGCSSLVRVDFSQAAAVPTLANVNAFANTNEYYQIIVPEGLYDAWISATNWSNAAIQPHIVAYEPEPIMVLQSMEYSLAPEQPETYFGFPAASDAEPIYLSVTLPYDTNLGDLVFSGDYASDRVTVMREDGLQDIYLFSQNTGELGRIVNVKVGNRIKQVWHPASETTLAAGTMIWVQHKGADGATVTFPWNDTGGGDSGGGE